MISYQDNILLKNTKNKDKGVGHVAKPKSKELLKTGKNLKYFIGSSQTFHMDRLPRLKFDPKTQNRHT